MPTLVLFDTLANILFCIVVLAIQNLRKKTEMIFYMLLAL